MSTTSSGSSDGSLRSLCEITKRACDALTPMIVSVYNSIQTAERKGADGQSKLKADDSAFTIADGVVQYLLTKELFGDIGFRSIVGEEECDVNISRRPFMVDDLVVPDEFIPIIEKARSDIQELVREIPLHVTPYKSLTVFIDPIDGTREFVNGKGDQCSVCVGFSDSEGRAVAGVVYRPLTDPPTWASGAKSEAYFESVLNDEVAGTKQKSGLLTSNGSVSPFLIALMDELGFDRIPSGGAGNKMLMLLEGRGSAYIQDRGVSRWDTCAAQACIEASGGVLCKLTSFVRGEDKLEDSWYKYLQSDTNLDFEEGMSNLTVYNCKPSLGLKKGDPIRLARNVDEVKPYSNLCGIFALAREENTEERKKDILKGLKRAGKESPPAYD